MPTRMSWVAINYNLPINPSKNRVYVWRKLKELGAVPLNHGVAALPKSSAKVSELVLLCERVKALGGEAVMIEMTFVNLRDEQDMIKRFEAQGMQEYDELLAGCDSLLDKIKAKTSQLDEVTSEEIKRLVKKYGKVRERRHYDEESMLELEKRIDKIFDRCVADASDLAGQIKKLIDKAKF